MSSQPFIINRSPSATVHPKLSIITVIKNADQLLPALIENVKEYKTEEIEFVIIDGGSTDHSLKIINNNLATVDTWISEPDKGIYDAMNKSIQVASGSWLYFMGADDQLSTGFTTLVKNLNEDNTLYYGGVIFDGNPKSKSYSAYDLTKENVCHQAIFYPREVFKTYRYEPRYEVFADYHLNIRIWNDPRFKKQYIDQIVAYYAPGGFSHFTKDLEYNRDRENWFKWYSNTNDYLRYLNRTKGIGGVLRTILLPLKPAKGNSLQASGKKKNLLVIDDDLPQYDKSSGSKRLFELLKLFIALDYKVFFLPDDGKITTPYYQDLLNIGVEVVTATSRVSGLEILNDRSVFIDYAWISRPALNRKYHPLLNPKTKKIFDTVDLHYLRMLRQAENQMDASLMKKALKIKKLELKLAHSSDATLTVTETEKDILEKEGIKNITVIPNIHEQIPSNGKPSFKERSGLVFIGGYKHEPNVDAVLWLINDIMPLVWAKLGDIPVYLLGSYPSKEILNLASDKVFVPGYIDDVSPYFLKGKVFVAPLRYGAGMKGKIGQSLQYGLPSVSTSIGTEGMNLIHEQNVLNADETSTFAVQVIRLYEDEVLWNKISKASLDSITNYLPENVKKHLKKLFEELDHTSKD